MSNRTVLALVALGLLLIPLSAYLVGCEGGGGESGAVIPAEGTSTGSVALLIADGPAEDYDHIWITITEISLIPPEGDGAPAVIYESDGEEIDLLKYCDEDLVFTVNNAVPAGDYAKVRLQVSEITTVGGPCDSLEIKLPSEKIDLNPGETFTVSEGTTLHIRLDIDANKSLELHTAGQSGKCIFRPVVFVEIAPSEAYCTSILTGTIVDLLDTDGFLVNLSGDNGQLEVHIAEDTVIFDTAGNRVDPSSLAEDQEVVLKGWLDGEGYLRATFVVAGDDGVVVLEGEVKSSVDQGSQFAFTTEEEDITVELTQEKLILVGCDTEVGEDVIQEGLHAQVVGWLDGDLFYAIVVLLELEEITGQIVAIEPTGDGMLLTISREGESDVEVLLPDGTPIYLEGDGLLDSEFLCEARAVRVVLDPEYEETLTASKVYLQSEQVGGAVEETDESSRTLTIDGITVHVQPTATILDTRGDDDTLASFDAILAGDEVKCFGLESCAGDGIFVAFVVVIAEL